MRGVSKWCILARRFEGKRRYRSGGNYKHLDCAVETKNMSDEMKCVVRSCIVFGAVKLNSSSVIVQLIYFAEQWLKIWGRGEFCYIALDTLEGGGESTKGFLFKFQGSKQPRHITFHYNNQLPPRCSWGLRSSEILRSVGRWLVSRRFGKTYQ